MKENYDVIVVGAATAGSYYAKLMSEKGAKVLLIDKLSRAKIGKRLDIFHVDRELFSIYDVPRPKIGDEDYVREFDDSYVRSPENNYQKTVSYPFVVMRMPQYIKRLNKWAESFGVEFSFDTEFLDFVYDQNGKIVGAKLKKDDQIKEISAKIVVDASGIKSVCRTKLKDNYGVENFEISSSEQFYVLLRYVKLLNPEKDRVEKTCGWASYKSWIAPQYDNDGAIIGIGQAFSYENAEKMYKEFFNKIPLPPHRELYIEKGSTPFRRTPYSFVADGFITIGDSACITKPFSGEGVTAAWNLCKIAAEISSKVIGESKSTTRENLWAINSTYQRNQGAKFAYLLASIIGAVDSSFEEQEFMFKNDIVFSDKIITDTNRYFEVRMSLKDSIKIVIKMLSGMFNRKISIKTLKSFLGSLLNADKLRKHYEKYPLSEKNFSSWQEQAEILWEKAGNIADTY